jgi:Uma2 family endonuclease
VINFGAELRARLLPPCRVLGEAGVLLVERGETWYQVDLAVTCTTPDRSRHHVLDPILLVEVLSPTTEVHDRGCKLEDYCRLLTVNEILLISSEERRVRYWRRDGPPWIVEDMIGEAGAAPGAGRPADPARRHLTWQWRVAGVRSQSVHATTQP